jgi:hypothetical protein
MKAIEEAARKYASEHYNVDLGTAFSAGVEFAQSWINANEELPKENEIVLIKLSLILRSGNEMEVFSMGSYSKKWDILHPLIENKFHCTAWNVTGWRKINLK